MILNLKRGPSFPDNWKVNFGLIMDLLWQQRTKSLQLKGVEHSRGVFQIAEDGVGMVRNLYFFYVGPCFSINKELRNSMFWKLTLGNRVIVNCDRARLRHLLDMTSRVGLIKNGAGVFLGGYSCKYLGHISVLDVEL